MKRIGSALFLLSAGLLFAAAGFESPPTLKPSTALGQTPQKGTNYQISNQIPNDGYTNTYNIESSFGPFVAYGDSMLNVRLQEIEGIAALKEVSSSEAFAKAAAGKLTQPVTSAKKIVEDPKGTVKGIPGGIKNKFENLGRFAKKATKKEEKPVDPQEEEEEEAAESGGGETVAKAVLGVTAAHRKWAQQAAVDPYSTNPVLQDELNRLARVDAAAGLTVKVAMKDVPGVRTLNRVYNLAWGMDPQELQKRNEKRLKEMGVDSNVSTRFLNNKHLTVTHQTAIIESLYELGQTENRTEFLQTAAKAKSERDAFLYSDSATMIASMKKSGQAINSFVPNPRIAVLRSGKKLVAVVPADYLSYTQSFKDALNGFEQNNAAEIRKASGKEIWLSGSASDKARAELKLAGWIARENILNKN
jgi:hypothetical protein